jgi:hypothetical protein
LHPLHLATNRLYVITWHYHCVADHTKDTSCHSVLGYKDNLLLTYGVSLGAGDIRPCQFVLDPKIWIHYSFSYL